jgi:glutathione synthase/RimK-type ligase-like ATP-grasp enzyme
MEGLKMKNVYVWYSAATDVTGKKIMETLGCAGGTAKPAAKYTKVLCWGTKTDKDIDIANADVYNHPNYIRVNRNKLQSLGAFKKGACNVADFTDDFAKAGTKEFPFPLVARTKYHQGGAGFWLCLTKAQVKQAIEEGAQYIQNFIEIKDEYRLHVVGGKVVYAVKKVQRDNHRDAFKAHWTEHCENYAAKKEINLDKATIDVIMGRLARKYATGVDMVVRSNTRGWKFSRVTLDKLDKALSDEAVKAVEALKLKYGAVDCCITEDGKPYIIECNTGPGLEGSSLEAVSTALKELVIPKLAVPAQPDPKPVAEADQAAPVVAAAVKAGNGGAKNNLAAKAAMLVQMAEIANDEEAAVLNNLLGKMGLA